MKLISFDATKKISLIKEMKAFLNLGLKEAKEFVESTPALIKNKCKIEEAEQIKEKFKDLANIEFE